MEDTRLRELTQQGCGVPRLIVYRKVEMGNTRLRELILYSSICRTYDHQGRNGEYPIKGIDTGKTVGRREWLPRRNREYPIKGIDMIFSVNVLYEHSG